MIPYLLASKRQSLVRYSWMLRHAQCHLPSSPLLALVHSCLLSGFLPTQPSAMPFLGRSYRRLVKIDGEPDNQVLNFEITRELRQPRNRVKDAEAHCAKWNQCSLEGAEIMRRRRIAQIYFYGSAQRPRTEKSTWPPSTWILMLFVTTLKERIARVQVSCYSKLLYHSFIYDRFNTYIYS